MLITLLFLVSHQRSGSHFLKEALRGPNYLALPEVFHPAPTELPEFEEWLFKPFHDSLLRAEPLRWGKPDGIAQASELFLDRLRDQSVERTALADIKFNQLHIDEGWWSQPSSTPRLVHKIASMGKIIFLRRRNLLRAIISGWQATRSGVWHNRTGTAAQVNLTVDVDNLLREVNGMEQGLAAVEGWLSQSSDSVLHVHYEDLFDARSLACNPRSFDRIAAFAGLPSGLDWRPSMRKIETRSLIDVVENIDELREAISATRYAGMLD
ncbi:MAG: Stf0 family sulfotransferase [Hyphomicrobiales bacterium]|nr:Stf0 family sulfotransferase [Hyphomicrobiales bacterium]